MEHGSPFLTCATTLATFRCLAAECDGNYLNQNIGLSRCSVFILGCETAARVLSPPESQVLGR